MDADLIENSVAYCDTIEIFIECPKCGGMNELNSHLCKFEKCQEDLTIHPISFQWKIYLEIPKEYQKNPISCYETRVFASGSILHSIMGMTCNDFIELSNNHGFETMTYLLGKYFHHSKFLIDRGYDRIFRIHLLKGCQLTFLNWLSMQSAYGFDRNIIISEIFNLYMNDSEEEEEEERNTPQSANNKKYAVSNKFKFNFWQKITKIFGEPPFPIKSNIYSFIESSRLNLFDDIIPREKCDQDNRELDDTDFNASPVPLEASVYS